MPAYCNLMKRCINVGCLCPICNGRPETTMHALWCFSSLEKNQTCCSFMGRIKAQEDMHFIDFMLACKNHLLAEDFELLCLVIWRIWRNGQVHNSKTVFDEDVVPWAASFLTDYWRANSQPTASQGVTRMNNVSWKPPEGKLFKH
ncbi:hypothetical protein Dsin_002304 [Dipteronia sinensis]|uniref:Reverse transcriptase zinc-binding domain-containing protein n=1 Tax=Dipteronia sinensis TaxID=43782 RepID=A0AAE0EJ51_9ROSI|nr:hypothetical protein Dsin_002304 [Dipteronia sinensis]